MSETIDDNKEKVAIIAQIGVDKTGKTYLIFLPAMENKPALVAKHLAEATLIAINKALKKSPIIKPRRFGGAFGKSN